MDDGVQMMDFTDVDVAQLVAVIAKTTALHLG